MRSAQSKISLFVILLSLLPAPALAQDSLAISYRYAPRDFPQRPGLTHTVILSNGYTDECCPEYNPYWMHLPAQTFIVTCERWIPYPVRWQITEDGIAWVIADTAIDGNGNGTADYYEFDYNGDGYVGLPDLTWFGEDYGTGKRWDLSDFTAMGQIYNQRRSDD